MRRLRQGLGLILAVSLGAMGCGARNISPRPPKRAEEIIEPPRAEARFSTPPIYPEPLNQKDDSARASNGRGGPGGQPNMGAMGGGMGGMGGMGGGMGGMGMGGMGMGGMGMGGMGMGGMNGGYGR